MYKNLIILTISVCLLSPLLEASNVKEDKIYQKAKEWLVLEDPVQPMTIKMEKVQAEKTAQGSVENQCECEQECECKHDENCSCEEMPGMKHQSMDDMEWEELKDPEKKEKQERKNVIERFLDKVIQSDPLGVARYNKQKINERDVFSPIHPKLVRFDGFKRTLGNRMSVARDLGHHRSASLNFFYAPLKLKAPFSHMKMQSFDLGLSYRKYFKEINFFQASSGFRYYDPNLGYKQYYQAKGQNFKTQTLPYLTVGLGRRIVRKLPIIKRPLVLSASYTFSKDLKYPSADPFGYRYVDLSGFNLGFSIRFKI